MEGRFLLIFSASHQREKVRASEGVPERSVYKGGLFMVLFWDCCNVLCSDVSWEQGRRAERGVCKQLSSTRVHLSLAFFLSFRLSFLSFFPSLIPFFLSLSPSFIFLFLFLIYKNTHTFYSSSRHCVVDNVISLLVLALSSLMK